VHPEKHEVRARKIIANDKKTGKTLIKCIIPDFIYS
jgi:hypothetical protein